MLSVSLMAIFLLVEQATPLLDTAAVDQLVDPRLQGKYDASELSRMVFAASLCVRKSSDYRPKMTRVSILQPSPLLVSAACPCQHEVIPFKQFCWDLACLTDVML